MYSIMMLEFLLFHMCMRLQEEKKQLVLDFPHAPRRRRYPPPLLPIQLALSVRLDSRATLYTHIVMRA